jgi:ArsR family transcriptional regulator, zinc-responsive transcriptional repressor
MMDATEPTRTPTQINSVVSMRTLDAASDLIHALAAPVRIAIVLELRGGARHVYELVDLLDAPQPLVSQHLRVLKSVGVVRGVRNGRKVAYGLVDDHIVHIVVDALAHVAERTG